MQDSIDEAIKILSKIVCVNTSENEALKYTQAINNLTQSKLNLISYDAQLANLNQK